MVYYQKTGWGIAKKQTFNGVKYDSKFEANKGKELQLMKDMKEIEDFETHVRIPLEVNGYLICTYEIDFVIYHKDGTVEYLETKGRPSPSWSIKWKLFEALYSEKPDVRLTVEFQGRGRPPKARKIKRGVS